MKERDHSIDGYSETTVYTPEAIGITKTFKKVVVVTTFSG